MKHKLILILTQGSALWALTLGFITLPSAAQAQFDYTIGNGTITITGYDCTGGAVVIPDTINGLPVTSIGSSAFRDCTSLTRVTIGNSVTSIGESVFSGCTGLTHVTMGNSVTSIGPWTFWGCTSLSSVTIPNSVTGIELTAFAGCTRLTAIEVEPQNSAYSSLEGVLFNKNQDTLILYPPGKAGSYLIPNSVRSIGWRAFSGCTGLTSVIIPDGVTYIGGGGVRRLHQFDQHRHSRQRDLHRGPDVP